MKNSSKNPDSLIDNKLSIQIVSDSHYFTEYIDSLCSSLRRRNVDVLALEQYDGSRAADVVVFVGATVKEIETFKKIRKKGIPIGAILTEQPTSRQVGFFKTGKRMMARDKKICDLADVIYVWSKEQYEAFCEIHQHVLYLPYAYMPAFDYTDKFGDLEKKYDILFLGDSDRPHREILLNKLREKYNVLTTYYEGQSLWGEDKYKAIHQAKICINIHQESGLIMEKPRMYEYFSNQAFVLSESMMWTDPFVKGEDFDTYYYSDILDKINYYLENDSIREQIAKNAYHKVKNIKMDDSADILLDGIMMELSLRYYRCELRKARSVIDCILKPYRYLKWRIDSSIHKA